jgi:glycosyltransferase involved in cell wall biosynthesis
VTIAVVPTGGLARVGGRFGTYSSYGEFLDELGAIAGGLTVYAPVIERGYPEYEYHADHLLNPQYCRVIPMPSHPRGDPSVAIIRNYAVQFWTFLRDVRRWQRVLIYSPSVTASLATVAWRVARAHPQRVVAYVWGDWQQLAPVLPQRGVLRRLLDPMQRRILLMQEGWLVRHADATLVAGAALLRKYAEVGKVVTETVPMMKMDQLMVGRAPSDRTESRLLFVGRLVPGKGLEILLKALALLKSSVPTASLRIVGGGDEQYVTELTGIAHGLGVGGAIEFAGVVPNGSQLWREYEEAKLFVCPSLSEGFPRVLYEAMALGVPIVSTAVGGVPNLLTDGVHALLVPPGDAERLADACKQVLSDVGLASGLAKASHSLFTSVQQNAAGMSPAKRVADLLDRGGSTLANPC